MNLYEDIKQNSSDLNKVRELMQFLIKDEEEAITGYKDILSKLNLYLSDEAISLVEEKFNHIIAEEQEHIKEIEEVFKQIKPLI